MSMAFISRSRDKAILINTYLGTAIEVAKEDNIEHVAAVKQIARIAAQNDMSLSEAFDLLDEYYESIDHAVENEVAMEGEDPANLDIDNEIEESN